MKRERRPFERTAGEVTQEAAHFHSSAGRTTTEFALLCMGAATLACISGGQYTDGQNNLVLTGQAAIVAAVKEIKAFVAKASEQELLRHRFAGWEKQFGPQ